MGLIILAGIILNLITIPFYPSNDSGQSLISGGPSPEEVVIIQLNAFYNDDLDTLLENTCDSLDDSWTNSLIETQDLMRSIGMSSSDFKFDFSDLNIVRIDSGGGRSIVMGIESGYITLSYQGKQKTLDITDMPSFDESRLMVIPSNGRWVIYSP